MEVRNYKVGALDSKYCVYIFLHKKNRQKKYIKLFFKYLIKYKGRYFVYCCLNTLTLFNINLL